MQTLCVRALEDSIRHETNQPQSSKCLPLTKARAGRAETMTFA